MPKLFHRSIRLRLTAWFSLVSLLVFTTFGGVLYWALKSELNRAIAAELNAKSAMFKHFLTETSNAGDDHELKHRFDDALLGHDELRVWLLDSSKNVLYGGAKAPNFSQPLDPYGHGILLREDGINMLGMLTKLEQASNKGPVEMVVALDTRAQSRLLAWFRLALLGICLLGVSSAAILGGIAAWHSLRPLRLMSAQARLISNHSLSTRLTAAGAHREVQELMDSFNHALDRLELSYKRVEAFNADVAHELRTPLATLINSTQVAISKPRPASELAQCLGENLDDLERLKRLINDMLFLARADQGAYASELVMVELSNELSDVVEYYDATLAEEGVEIQISGRARAVCNPALVRRAMSNLVSNAIKHGLRGSKIRISLMADQDVVKLSVENSGQRIDAITKERMFDRFFQADPARAKVGDSHGLGLAIVKAIVSMHGGSVFVENELNTVVGFKLPTRISASAILPS